MHVQYHHDANMGHHCLSMCVHSSQARRRRYLASLGLLVDDACARPNEGERHVTFGQVAAEQLKELAEVAPAIGAHELVAYALRQVKDKVWQFTGHGSVR